MGQIKNWRNKLKQINNRICIFNENSHEKNVESSL